MMKKIICFLLMLMLILSIGISASAATTAGLIYDETEQLLTDNTKYLGEEYYYLIAKETGIAVYIDIYTSIGDAESLAAAVEYVYTNSGFGYGEDKSGLLLALHVVPEGDGWALNDGEAFAIYGNHLPKGLRDEIIPAIEPFLSPGAWVGGLSNDQIVVSGLAAALGNTVMNFDQEAVAVEPETETQPAEEIKASPTAPEAPMEQYASYTPFEGEYLTDSYGLLTEAEQTAIESMAKQASEKHDCGIYVMLVDDFTQLNGNTDIYKANYTYYHDNNMGLGEGRDGIFLLLSMNDRDFSFFVYGEKAEYALNDWGQMMLEDEFVDDLADNRWYDGLEDFVNTCDEYLTLAEQGDPVREPPAGKLALSTAISSFIALLASSFMWNKNKWAKERTSAYGYISGTLVCDISEDRYLNTTVKKRIIEDDSNSGGSGSRSSVSHSGGGGSGRSGKF